MGWDGMGWEFASRVKAAGQPPWDLRNSIAWSASQEALPIPGRGRAHGVTVSSPVQPGWRTLLKWQCAGCTVPRSRLELSPGSGNTTRGRAAGKLPKSGALSGGLLWQTTRRRPAEGRSGSVADF
jgi:hypothetical protein